MFFYLRALGCRLNEAELQSWSQQLIDAGYQLTTSVEKADLLILNSCAVTGEAARKSRQTVRRLHRENPKARIVITGCYASLDETEASSILGVDLVIHNSAKDQLVEKIIEHFHLDNELLHTMPNFATEPGENALFIRNRDRAFIKIQDGCRYRCSYCIVTVARGAEKSRSINDIIQEINQFSSQGIHEIVLTGVHVGGYGSDINCTLKELVETILSDTDIPRIRFASVEPWDLGEQFFELFDNQRLMPHMHLPLQSGSDTVLKRMSRRCTINSFKTLAEKARIAVKDFNITTDIIVGFPGETDYEWQQTMDNIQQIGFGHIHIFRYSHREGTRAAKLADQLSSDIKKRRNKQLADIAVDMRTQSMEKMLGKNVPILWESGHHKVENNQFQYYGYTPNYHKVSTVQSANLSGQLIPATLEALSESGNNLSAQLSDITKSRLSPLISVKQL
jgi:threonylcarbamoyladenosine tRNA methylthiotransferase MtaB